jgi:hypothetical protein
VEQTEQNGTEWNSPPLPYFRPDLTGARMPYDPEFRRWQAIRFLYRTGLYAVIGPIAIYVANFQLAQASGH